MHAGITRHLSLAVSNVKGISYQQLSALTRLEHMVKLSDSLSKLWAANHLYACACAYVCKIYIYIYIYIYISHINVCNWCGLFCNDCMQYINLVVYIFTRAMKNHLHVETHYNSKVSTQVYVVCIHMLSLYTLLLAEIYIVLHERVQHVH